MKKLILALKEVYKKPRYFLISLFVALILITFNIGLINYKLYFSFPSFAVVRAVFLGTFVALPFTSVFFIILSSMLVGVLISMLVFHISTLRDLKSPTAGGGIFLAVIAPACPSCGVGLIALLGGAGFFTSLPYGGLEVSILAVILLAVAIIVLSNKIVKKSCNI